MTRPERWSDSVDDQLLVLAYIGYNDDAESAPIGLRIEGPKGERIEREFPVLNAVLTFDNIQILVWPDTSEETPPKRYEIGPGACRAAHLLTPTKRVAFASFRWPAPPGIWWSAKAHRLCYYDGRGVKVPHQKSFDLHTGRPLKPTEVVEFGLSFGLDKLPRVLQFREALQPRYKLRSALQIG